MPPKMARSLPPCPLLLAAAQGGELILNIGPKKK